MMMKCFMGAAYVLLLVSIYKLSKIKQSKEIVFPYLGISLSVSFVLLSLGAEFLSIINFVLGLIMVLVVWSLTIMFDSGTLNKSKKINTFFVCILSLLVFGGFVLLFIKVSNNITSSVYLDYSYSAEKIGKQIVDRYLIAFELLGSFLMLSLVGIMVLIKPWKRVSKYEN